MYQQPSNGPPSRGLRLAQQRRFFFLNRNPRAVQNGGNGGHDSHQQAAVGEVRMPRQPPTTAAVQGRDGLQGGSVRPHLHRDSSTTRPQENPQNTSPMQEQNVELDAYLSENFSTLQQFLSDTTDRLDRLSARDEAFYKSFESTLGVLTERVEKLGVKVESFYKLIESFQAFPTPEHLDADGVDLGDMTNLVNF
ncbi:hypothetical protein BDP55DRAFT_639107 [Colletotrichum godetiae]|uniref:Uncharacterized protein n=1 Tax=Colletotrichum godetiae TaxID=1209918 RepID=A0AAJ0A5V1_9PEZI|nr:uncharacterized protein BDP55DRAFT_639107 [Colletotrichum godetiae]KAK1657054.1 hypothetical protein BDP55DRAFT_639107 [Colletotrichum godetiae]